MKKYKNYIIGTGILIIGIFLGSIFSSDKNSSTTTSDEHDLVQDPVTKLWTCSMHPQIKMEKPGNCPICGMELIPLDEDSTGENVASNEIVFTEEAMQLANIQTYTVQSAAANKEIRLLGKVQPDERKLYSQVSHIPGRIERLYVNFTGEKIHRGQRIVRVYSPDLITAQKELFEAIKSKDIYPQLYTASRNKLKLWKLSDAQISAIEKSGKVQEQIDILSDYTGYVMKRNVELGDHIMTGSNLFDIANLSTVWVMFEAYETDIPWIHIGDKVSFTIQALPGRKFNGKVTYVDPFVSSSTRVAKVRVEVKNPSNKLLPEMYANGIINAKLRTLKNAIVIPKSAVLWTGKRAVVYIKVPHQKIHSFTYKEIVLGQDMGDLYIVKEGLKEGDIIATNGVYRIDASAQLMGQKSMMNPEGGKISTGGHAGMDMGEKTTSSKGSDMSKNTEVKVQKEVDHTNMNKRIEVKKEFKNQLNTVFNAYLKLKDALVKDNNNLAKNTANEIVKTITSVDMKLLTNPEAHNHWMVIQKEVLSSAKAITSSNLEMQRSHFKHLSAHLIKAVKLFGVNQTVYEQFCPMADDNKGAYWMSLNKDIKNPYLNADMRTCGEVKNIIK